MYYTLLKLNVKDGYWYPQFGDYDRSVVKAEKRDSYSLSVTTIIETEDDQASIDAAIAELNRDIDNAI
jgi:hypothetical protein